MRLHVSGLTTQSKNKDYILDYKNKIELYIYWKHMNALYQSVKSGKMEKSSSCKQETRGTITVSNKINFKIKNKKMLLAKRYYWMIKMKY